MPVNKRSKYRGSRTCGGGTHKNRRGAGNRGGRGRAGHRDHRFTHYLLRDEVHNGKHGFVNPVSREKTALSVGAIDLMADRLVEEGLATREGDLYLIDVVGLGIEKVLGGGQVRRMMNLSANAFSVRAKEKIEARGGQTTEV